MKTEEERKKKEKNADEMCKKSENSSSSRWLLPPISFSSIAMTEEDKMQMKCVKIRKLVVFTVAIASNRF